VVRGKELVVGGGYRGGGGSTAIDLVVKTLLRGRRRDVGHTKKRGTH
jgi:hypothetical protein